MAVRPERVPGFLLPGGGEGMAYPGVVFGWGRRCGGVDGGEGQRWGGRLEADWEWVDGVAESACHGEMNRRGEGEGGMHRES